ncbi:MAG: DUF423 domain-containing protein [Desulfobacterales bacterium]
MSNRKTWLALSAAFGFSAVALGAFGAHGLQGRLDAYGRHIWDTATHYLMFHAAGLAVVGLLRGAIAPTALNWAGSAFTAGILLFSGSLYLMAVTGEGWIGRITPVGGTAFLIGWIALLAGIVRS